MQHWSHDIEDPERFVAKIVAQRGGELEFHQRERLQQFLLIALWELSLVYDRGNPQFPSNFSGYAGTILPRRITDWRRSPEEGGRTKWRFADRTYERSRPDVSSFDQLDGALLVSAMDVAEDCPADLVRALREGSGEDARRVDSLGASTPRLAA